MIFLTIFNTVAIIYIFYKTSKYRIEFRKHKTSIGKTLVGYGIVLWKKFPQYEESSYSFVIPIRNKKKVEKKEEIQRMITKYDDQQRIQTLNAKFSWLKTWEEVNQFKKDYVVVDALMVEKLVRNFTPKYEN